VHSGKAMTNNHRVDILILNFGNHADTLECLRSIEANDYHNCRLTIVDILNLNNSVDIINHWISDHDPASYHLIQINENMGFAFANNLGLKHILEDKNSEYIWLLNNDTKIAPDSITELIDYYEQFRDDKIGFVGSKLLDYSKPDQIQTMGSIYKPWTGYFKIIGEGELDKGQYDNMNLIVDYIFGAAMFCHKSLIKEIGLMPEEYFLYFEDVDWCVAAKKSGFKTRVCSSSKVYHKQGGSTGTIHKEKRFDSATAGYLYKNYLKFYRKHHKFLIPVAYLILIKQLAGHLYHRRLKAAGLVIKAILGR